MNLIEDILDLSRFEFGKFELNLQKMNLYETISEVTNMLNPQFKQKKIYLKKEISKNTPKYIVSDKKRIKQVLFNLLSNALKFTVKGGIVVKVSRLSSFNDNTLMDSNNNLF